MTKEELENNVIRIVAEQLGVAEETVKPDTKMNEDLAADSLDEVELLMAFEEEYGIDINDETAEKIKTVKDIVDVVEKLTGEV